MATGMLVHDMIYLPFATKWYNSTLVLSSWFLIFFRTFDLWSSWWACQRFMKNLWRSSSGPLKLCEDHVTDLRKSLKIFFRNFEALDNLVKDLWKSFKIFFRTFEALEDLVTDLWKILKGLLQDLWSSWGSCQSSMKNPWRSSSRHLKLLKILSKIYEKS